MLGRCKFHPRLWLPSAKKRVTVSCDAALKTHPKEMAATAFIVKDQRSIPLFAGVCWGYKFKKNTQLEGESLRLWTTFLAQRKSMTELHVETDLDTLPGIVNSRLYGEKDISCDPNWSFLSGFRAEVVRPNSIWFEAVPGSVNKVAHNLTQIGCLYNLLEENLNLKVWTFRKELKRNNTYKVKVLKDPTTSVEVEVVEKNAPRELKLCLALDFVRRYLVVHRIKEKESEQIKIPKFNSSDEIGRFFLGVIEGNIDFIVLQRIILI